jgi:hypothetical protein
MASKRQQKRRHERARTRPIGRPDQEREAPARSRAAKPGERGSTRAGVRGAPPKPSYARSFKRALIFAALWFVVLELTPIGGDQSSVANAFQAGLFLFVLAPVGYMTEQFAWRRWKKRQGSGADGEGGPA